MDHRYKAFISYSHADSSWAEWLLHAIEKYRVPKDLVGRVTSRGEIPKKLAPIFRDRDELPATGQMSRRLFEAIEASEFLIVLCSPKSATSKLVNKEIAEFKRVHGDGKILCLIIDGEPFSKKPGLECFPEALLHAFTADGAKAGLTPEGLAADARQDGDGKQMALMKIIAGMLGVGLNEVVRRETQRRNRRIAGAAAASVAAMLVMGSLTYEAMSARAEAERQAAIAAAKSEEAQRRLDENEELARLLNNRLYVELLKSGSLDALERVSLDILAHYQSKDIKSFSDEQFLTFTGIMLRYGQQLDWRGRSDGARSIFETTLKLSREFFENDPSSTSARFRLQNNLFFVGYLADRQGRLEEAEAAYRERLALMTSVDNLNLPFERTDWPVAWREIPNAFWREKKADAESYLARLLANSLGRPQEAIAYGRSSVKTREELGMLRPDNQLALFFLGSAYINLGHAYLRGGELDLALDAFEKRKNLFEAVIGFEPDNLQALVRILTSKENMALIKTLQGDLSSAIAIYQKVTADFDQLTQQDPENTSWLAGSAHNYSRLAETLALKGDWLAADLALKTANEQIAEVLKRDNSRPRYKLTQHRTSLVRIGLMAEKDDLENALELASMLEADMTEEPVSFYAGAGARELQASVSRLVGDLHAKLGDQTRARGAWQRAADAIGALPGELSLPAQHELMLAYERLEQSDAAMSLRRKLEAAGYSLKVGQTEIVQAH